MEKESAGARVAHPPHIGRGSDTHLKGFVPGQGTVGAMRSSQSPPPPRSVPLQSSTSVALSRAGSVSAMSLSELAELDALVRSDASRDGDGATASGSNADAAGEEEGSGHVEVYGFVGWIVTFFLFAFYLLWAYIPEDMLQRIGVTYYPNKYWAIAVPTQLVFTGIFILVLYWAINLIATNPLSSLTTITDSYALKQASITNKVRTFDDDSQGSLPPIEDIPIEVVNELLYCKGSRPRRRQSAMYSEESSLSKGISWSL